MRRIERFPGTDVLRTRLALDAPTVTVLAVTLLFLLATRLPGIGQSLWHDEVLTVADYALPGPSAIWDADRFIPNNHPLFSVVTWMSTSITSASEALVRLWSIVPGIVGVLCLVLHAMRQWGLGAGVLTAGFLASHGLHQELVPQARGYGLAFLAGCVALIAADGAARRPTERRHGTVLAVAGFVGTATLVVFVVPIAFLFAALFAFGDGSTRRRLAAKAAAMFAGIGLWWLPLLDGVVRSSSQEFGARLAIHGPLTGWLHHLGITQLGDLTSVPGPVLVLGRLVFAILAASTVWVCVGRNEWRRAVLLVGPLVVTYAVLAAGRFFVEPRFSFHLLPFFTMAIVVGPADVLGRMGRTPRRVAFAVAALALVLPLGKRIADAADVRAHPAEALAGAARVIERDGGGHPIVTNSVHPAAFRYYVDGDLKVQPSAAIERQVCRGSQPITVIDNPYLTAPLRFECPRAAQARTVTLQQRMRGGHLRIWFFPGARR